MISWDQRTMFSRQSFSEEKKLAKKNTTIYLLASGVVHTHALQLGVEQGLTQVPLIAALGEGETVTRDVVLKVIGFEVNVSSSSGHKGEHGTDLHHC